MKILTFNLSVPLLDFSNFRVEVRQEFELECLKLSFQAVFISTFNSSAMVPLTKSVRVKKQTRFGKGKNYLITTHFLDASSSY